VGRDAEPIVRIDEIDGSGQIDDLTLAKMLFHTDHQIVIRVPLRDEH